MLRVSVDIGNFSSPAPMLQATNPALWAEQPEGEALASTAPISEPSQLCVLHSGALPVGPAGINLFHNFLTTVS